MSGPPSLPATASRERAPSLVVAGALMFVAGLLLANPLGATDTRWPWQILAHWPWERPDVNWALWYLTAASCLVLGTSGSRRLRAPWLCALALLLLTTCGSGQAGLRLMSNHVGWYFAVGVLGAGLLLEAEGRAPRAARAASTLGALMLLAVLAMSFGPSPTGEMQSHLQQVVHDIGRRAMGQSIPDALPGYEIMLFASAAALLAAAIGLGVGLGLRGGLVARIGLLLLLLDFLIPTFHKLGIQMGGAVKATDIFSTLSEVLIHSGLALSLLLMAAGADALRLGSSNGAAGERAA